MDKDRAVELMKVIDKAIAMERNTRSFYLNASGHVDSVEGKKVLRWLADFEKSHESRLKSRREMILADPVLAGIKIESSKISTELSEAGLDPEIEEGLTDTEIVVRAMEFEKKAGDFYSRKASFAPEGPIRDLFLDLHKEEERHLKILEGQHQHLSVKRMWNNLDSIIRDTQ